MRWNVNYCSGLIGKIWFDDVMPQKNIDGNLPVTEVTEKNGNGGYIFCLKSPLIDI